MWCNYDSTEETILYIEKLETVRKAKILFATQRAMVKVTEGSEFEASKRMVAATKTAPEDRLICVAPWRKSLISCCSQRRDISCGFQPAKIPVKKKAQSSAAWQ